MSFDEIDLNVVTLVARRNLKHKTGAGKEVVKELTNITHCRLDREGLFSIPVLNFLPCLTNLYLQCNKIKEIPDLSYLTHLRFLTLAENKITEVNGLRGLENLGLLDLTENLIAVLDCEKLPKCLLILNIAENPCTASLTFRDNIHSSLPNLKSLDGQAVDNASDSDDDEEDWSSEDDESPSAELTDMSLPSSSVSKDGNNFSDFQDEMVESFQKFLSAMSRSEKDLRTDFDEFTSALPSPLQLQGDPMGSKISEQELSKLEKEAADIRDLPRLDSANKFSPRPPAGAKSTSSLRKKTSKNSTVTRVRTPGARPFQRVIK